MQWLVLRTQYLHFSHFGLALGWSHRLKACWQLGDTPGAHLPLELPPEGGAFRDQPPGQPKASLQTQLGDLPHKC